MVPTADSYNGKKQSSWILRFELDYDKVLFKNLSMSMIDKKICDHFADQINVNYSDDNAEKLILRLRVNDVDEDDEDTICMFLKDFQQKLY